MLSYNHTHHEQFYFQVKVKNWIVVGTYSPVLPSGLIINWSIKNNIL